MMQRLLDKLSSDRSCLLVSIPSNSIEPALAAQAGGADGIKLHINVTHHATNVSFGSWEEEAENIKKVIEAVEIPIGLVPGENLDLTEETLKKAADVGIQFVDSYSQFWPAAITQVPGIDMWAAFDSTFSLDEMCTIASFPWVDVVEASVIPVSDYGAFLSWRDLARFSNLQKAIKKPLVIPSQRQIRPVDIPSLLSLGLKNFLLGAVALGKSPEKIEHLTHQFRQALDA